MAERPPRHSGADAAIYAEAIQNPTGDQRTERVGDGEGGYEDAEARLVEMHLAHDERRQDVQNRTVEVV